MLKTKALNMLIEAVQDGGQAMRDPVGGSVEFHFVPILKLISTLLIMGVFDDDDVTHILEMIEPTVFIGQKAEELAEEIAKMKEEAEKKEPAKQLVVKDGEKEAVGEEDAEFDDDGLGEEEEEEEEEMEEEEEFEETEAIMPHKEMTDETEPINGEKGAEETEKETKPGETGGEAKEEHLEQGLFQMKLPESVKLQVWVVFKSNELTAPLLTINH